MMILIRCFILAIAVAAIGLPAFAQGVLSGRITGSGGAAVPGATIKVTSGKSPVSKGGYSDSRGRYTVKGLADGKYTVTVTCVGYQKSVSEDVEVSGNTSLNVTLTETAIDMDVTVITASRVQQKASEAPASVTVVEPRTIREAPKATPVEHIRGLAGIDYSQTGIAQQNVSVRGFNNVFSGSLLTLTDYRPAGVPSLRVNVGYFVPASNEDIERMELVRGPASALYGPNASQGVLNIITRSPFSSKGTTVFLAGGERGLLNAGLRHAGTLGESFGYKVTGQYFSADDWVFEDSTEIKARTTALAVPGVNPDTVKIGDRKGSKHERFNVDAGAYYMLGENTMVQINGGISQAVNTIEMTGLGAALGNGWSYTYANAQLTSGDLFAQVFTNMSDAGSTYFLRTGNPIVDRSTLLGGRLQHAYKVNDDIRLTYGADFFATNPVTDGTINGVNEENDNYTEIGGYLQADWKITSDLSALGALRVDQHSVIGEMVMSPRVALLYKLNDISSVRATFNTAFSNPGTNDLFLDLLSVRDAFGFSRTNQTFAVAVRGAAAGRSGYTYNRGQDGTLNFITQFDPTRSQWNSTSNVVSFWGIAAGAVAANPLVPAPFKQFIANIPAPAALAGVMRSLNPSTSSFSAPLANTDVVDVAALRQSSTQTIEVGYQGKLTDKLRIAVDVYHSTIRDFVSPLKVVTPNVFFNPSQVAAHLAPILTAAFTAQGLPADTIAKYVPVIIAGFAQVPVGTVSPNETSYKGDILLAYRNYGELSYFGSDAAFTYELSPEWAVSGSATWMSQNVFTGADLNDADSTAEIALNAPKYKSSLGVMHRNADLGLNVGLQWRWVDGFRMNSGVYVGDVNAYHMLDLTAQYTIPCVDGMSFNLTATNLLDHRVQQFIGAAAIGRLIQGRLTYTF